MLECLKEMFGAVLFGAFFEIPYCRSLWDPHRQAVGRPLRATAMAMGAHAVVVAGLFLVALGLYCPLSGQLLHPVHLVLPRLHTIDLSEAIHGHYYYLLGCYCTLAKN